MSNTTPAGKTATDESAEPIDYHPEHALVFLRAGDLWDEDTDADVSTVLDGDDVELRLSATLEDVSEIAGRDLFQVSIHAKDFPEEDDA